MNIVNFGHVCIDKNTSEHATYTSPGGPAYFMSKVFSQIPDGNLLTIASYAPDLLALEPSKSMHLYPQIPNVAKTLLYENDSRGRKRIQRAYYRDTALPVVLDAKLRKIVSAADALIFSPLLPNFPPEYISQVKSLAHRNVPILLAPQGYFRNFTKDNQVTYRDFIEENEILPLVDFVIVSRFDQNNMAKLARTWAKKFQTTVIETVGEKGAIMIERDKEVIVPTLPVTRRKIVDSVGAGDVFGAAFLYWYTKTNDTLLAVQFANAVAGQKLAFTPENILFDFEKAVPKL